MQQMSLQSDSIVQGTIKHASCWWTRNKKNAGQGFMGYLGVGRAESSANEYFLLSKTGEGETSC